MDEREGGVSDQEWKGVVVKKYGWSLRLKKKGRNILYLSPGKDCFMTSFVLSDKALDQRSGASAQGCAGCASGRATLSGGERAEVVGASRGRSRSDSQDREPSSGELI